MNREIFLALRNSGMSENCSNCSNCSKYSTRVAEAVPPADSLATKAAVVRIDKSIRAVAP